MTRDEFIYLRDLGRLLDDLEAVRIQNGNRIGATEREFGAAPPHYVLIQERLAAVEHETILELQRAIRRHPLAPWAKTVKGLGEKSLARLLGVIGDPVRATPYHWEGTGKTRILVEDKPFDRTVSQLWQYCGVGNPNMRRAKGMTAEDAMRLGNPSATVRLFVMARNLAVDKDSAYRGDYEEGRALYAGKDWTLGHQDMAARRLAMKRFLRDLWLETWRQRTLATGEVPPRKGGGRGKASQRRHQASRRRKVAA